LKTEFFLGANTARGFYSLYDGFCKSEGDFLYLIKGGAGCGKSGFMRRLGEKAEALGLDTELILCSGDPQSLDALYIPAMKTGFCDATAPHAAEPRVFGFDSCYVNLGYFCTPFRDARAAVLSDAYKEEYARAYYCLSAAYSVRKADALRKTPKYELENARALADELFERRLTHTRGELKRRFIRCISCEGEKTLLGTVQKLCKHIISLDDRSSASQHYLIRLLSRAEVEGMGAVVCRSPLEPESLDGIIFPDSELGVFESSVLPAYSKTELIVFGCTEPRGDLGKLYSDSIALALGSLKSAKLLHDELEALYRPCIDFDSLSRFTDGFAANFFA